VTLLIDPPDAAGHGRLWSHLASDTSYDELHLFARSLGIPERGFDRDHYDVPAERYESVVAAGAQPVSSRELIGRLYAAGLRRRKAETLGPRPPGRRLARARRLRAGDRVAVVAPAGPVRADRLQRGLDVLGSWGLDVRVAAHALGIDDRFGYLAADDADRAADLEQAWRDPDVAAVLCARGGYGAQRIVDLLDWRGLAGLPPKVLVGFSDVTALHQASAARLGLSTVHGPVVTSLGDADDESREHLRHLLLEPEPDVSLTPTAARTVVPGVAEGVLVGGNVSLLAAELGTPHARPAEASIAVLEDVGEEAYRLDRLLTHLLRAGWFDGVLGVAVGDLGDRVSQQSQDALLVDRLGRLGVPVVAGVPVGHGPRNLAFPLGVRARLDAGAGTLVVRDPALL
jgi:muramoyltetrapeptide carboxypeptidase